MSFQVQAEVFDSFKALLKTLHVYAPAILICIEIVMLVCGTALLVRAAKLHWNRRHTTDFFATDGLVTSEKQIPLMT